MVHRTLKSGPFEPPDGPCDMTLHKLSASRAKKWWWLQVGTHASSLQWMDTCHVPLLVT